LRVEVERHDGQLRYVVSDDGVGIQDAQVQHGTGLSNIARRLELLFPGAHTFTLAAREPQGTTATLGFPVVT
jgi:LytS/YehU family sensor histidine kinase